MRLQVLSVALAASTAASKLVAERNVVPRGTDSGDCLEDILQLLYATPTVPPELELVTSSYLPPNLTKASSGYSVQIVSWYSELSDEISDCPAYPSSVPPMLSTPTFPTCTGDKATATAHETGVIIAAAAVAGLVVAAL